MGQSKECMKCTASTVLQSGRAEGSLWCWVRGYSVGPSDCCASFHDAGQLVTDNKRDAFEGRRVGQLIRSLQDDYQASGVVR